MSLELSRRDNDKRITLLLVKMQDTMSMILEFVIMHAANHSELNSM